MVLLTRDTLVLLLLVVGQGHAFVQPLGISHKTHTRIVCRSGESSSDGNEISSSSTTNNNNNNNNKDDSKDLFEYFDPLRSPHDYPDGISPDNKPQDRPDSGEDAGPKMPMGLDLFASEFPSAFATPLEDMELLSDRTEFDSTEPPLLDDTTKKFATTTTSSSQKEEVEEEVAAEAGEAVDLFDVFDPTLSPHSYPNGIPSMTSNINQKKTTVGILLMDHGSRNAASNERLHNLARLYQESLDSTTTPDSPSRVIVKAAHMEIAEPSIPQVLEAMIKDEKVDEIICHPYFLSPGRHVVEDIPEIVATAMKDLDIQIPITTTKPVGSSTDLMIHAIHALVEKSSTTTTLPPTTAGGGAAVSNRGTFGF